MCAWFLVTCSSAFGIPVHCVLDNGRGFASKWITGGNATRFRFKVQAEDPTGLLVGLGCRSTGHCPTMVSPSRSSAPGWI
jgi:hypothetical protein